MKLYKALLAAAALTAVSCGHDARIQMTVSDDPSGEVVVKLLDVNAYKVLDTLKLDKAGKAGYKVSVSEGQPEFIYLFRGDRRLAAAVLLPGDRVTIEADTMGRYTVSGSEESALLQEVEQSFSRLVADMSAAVAAAGDGEEASAEVNRRLSRLYIDYYRASVKHIMEHPYSITNVPVCFRKLNDGLPVFGQETDAIHLRNAADSLMTVYPDSRYVKALSKEADRRMSLMRVGMGVRNAEQVSFPEIIAPDIKGEKISLSALDAKAVLLHFWTATDAAQKIINNDVLKPLYDEYHSKGLEIYAVAIDSDKSLWASTVKAQQLPWINVCDGLGTASPIVRNYNIGALPSTLVIVDGEVTGEDVSTTDKLRKLLSARLK